jgi:hypothetical protein
MIGKAQRNIPRDDQLGSPAQRLKSRNSRTSLDNNSEISMPATISNVPRKLEALRKRQKFYADRHRQTQSSRGFAKGDKLLVKSGKKNCIQEL